ncbi:MAG: hypothetical protein IJ802_02440, partial [Kiritimatiellae bacterium]|nr:hypothetical protein [Kiritimatiellia bacterium]
GEYAAAALAFCVLLAVTLASPFASSWRDFGHPFYPVKTADPEKFPPVDLTFDFREQNEDAASMSRVERFIWTMVSEDAVNFYRRKVLGQEGFAPANRMWSPNKGWKQPAVEGPKREYKTWMQFFFTTDEDRAREPPLEVRTRANPARVKVLFCAGVLVLLIFGDAAARMACVAMLCAVNAMPVDMVGYLRYVAWLKVALAVFAVQTVLVRKRDFWNRYVLKAMELMLCAGAIAAAARFPLLLALAIDQHQAYYEYFKANPNAVCYSVRTAAGFERPHDGASIQLRKRQVEAMRDVTFEEVADRTREYALFYDGSCLVDAETAPEKYLIINKNYAIKNRAKRLFSYVTYIARMLTVEAAKTAYNTMAGRL